MKAPQILLLVLAFGVGAGLVYAFKPGKGEDPNEELTAKLAAAEKRISELESKRPSQSESPAAPDRPAPESGDPSGLTAIPEAPEGAADEEPQSPEEAIAKLFNSPEARNLMKGFAQVASSRADAWIAPAVGEYKDKLNLSDAQVESITSRLGTMVQEETARFQRELEDDSRSMQEIMEGQGDFWRNNEEEISSMLREELDEDQYAQFETEQMIERTERVQSRADRELEAIDSKLDLDETQEDQVFSILVRESPEYDESMAIEGVEAELPAAAVAEDVSKEDAIRSVLNPDQVETYNTTLESGGFSSGRRGGPWGRGRGFR